MSYIILTCRFHKESHKWVAVCDELGTSTFGHTLDDAESKLDEAIDLHINTLEKVGEIERFFKENNVHIYDIIPTEMFIPITTKSNYFIRPCIQSVSELAAVHA